MASNQNEVKIFNCLLCDVKAFTQKSHLTSHIKSQHEENGKRECVSCDSSYGQINNFVVHSKKKHMNKNCGQCIGKNLCNLCEFDLNKAKLEWQLKPLEVQSPQFERVAGHTCTLCLKTFSQSSHLNSHIKLKHSASNSHVCPQCTTTFAQMNNFVVHFKKNHLMCDCKNKTLCNECIDKVAHAKTLWLAGGDAKTLQPSVEDSLREMFAGVVSDIERSETSNALNQISTVESPSPSFYANDSLTQAVLTLEQTLSSELSSGLITIPLAMAAIPAKRMKPLEASTVTSRESVLIGHSTNQTFQQYHTINECAPNTKKSIVVCAPYDSETCKAATIALIEESKLKEISCQFNVQSIQNKPRRTNVVISGSVSEVGTIGTTALASVETVLENSKCAAALPSINDKSVYDKMLGKIHSTQMSSESAHITQKSKEKHLNQANVDTVLCEAANVPLDIDLCKDLQKGRR